MLGSQIFLAFRGIDDRCVTDYLSVKTITEHAQSDLMQLDHSAYYCKSKCFLIGRLEDRNFEIFRLQNSGWIFCQEVGSFQKKCW